MPPMVLPEIISFTPYDLTANMAVTASRKRDSCRKVAHGERDFYIKGWSHGGLINRSSNTRRPADA